MYHIFWLVLMVPGVCGEGIREDIGPVAQFGKASLVSGITDCYAKCGNRGGRCPSICGEGGFCCKKGSGECVKDIENVSPASEYACVHVPADLLNFLAKVETVRSRFSNTRKPCSDTLQECPSYKTYCYNKDILKYCKITCGVCDVNECDEENGKCEHKCINTEGSYKCACNNGYLLESDGKGCKAPRPPRPPVSVNCSDKHEFCKRIAEAGYCQKKKRWMMRNCERRCTFCRKKHVCGVAQLRPQGRIVSGKNVEKGHWPWQVAIYYKDGFHCGGTLIGDLHVLTAAHCFVEIAKDLKDFKIVLGEHDRSIPEGQEQFLGVKNITVHESYKFPNTQDDIAIVELSDFAELSEHIALVCLPGEKEVPDPGINCYVTGWGKPYASGRAVNILQEIAVPVVDKATCTKLNSKPQFGKAVTDNMICTGYQPGESFKSACHGDSGGPLSCINTEGVWKLFGVVSWGSNTCDGSEMYNVFTKVSAYTSWIDKQINE